MKSLSRIVDFAFEQAAAQPAVRRIQLYRDLAAIASTAHESRALLALADELQAIEQRHEQLRLDFKRRSST